MENMPAFPTVELSGAIDWLVNGFTGMVSSNAAVVITAGLVMAGLPIAIKKIKGFGKSAMKG